MKAAVLHQVGGVPQYEDFPDPIAGDDEVLIEVKAVAVENVDRMFTEGNHYGSSDFTANLPAIPGFDGVGSLSDGTLVGFGGIKPPLGALAEKTVVSQDNVRPIPEGLDPAVAVTLATGVTGMAIKTAGGFAAGETVLIQGATGVAGRLAVKIARLLGAGRIVATGRDDGALAEISALGADVVINTAVSDEELQSAYSEARGDGFDVVLDFLWGRPTEVLMRALTPSSFGFPKPTRVVQVGQSAGATATLAAESLRTSGVEIYGAAKGFDATTIGQAFGQIVEWTRSGELTFDLERVPLRDIESAWKRTDLRGRRLVVIP
jgi:NADPH:quinone reductase-like Zn-dependent oxidoreductase